MKTTIKSLLLFFLALQAWGQSGKNLSRSTPAEEGVSSAGIMAFLDAVGDSKHELHSLMILRHGKVIAEGWWEPYGPDIKHTMYSVSKSFTATAIGFAVAEGKLTVNDKVIAFFPNDLPEKVSPNLEALHIKDLLSMSVGHGKDPTSDVLHTDNWVASFLKYPIVHEPGTKFVYNTAATYMLSGIIQKVTGETVLDYLTSRLFGPLGIGGIDWEKDPKGVNTGGYGLRLKTEDMAKFGQLFLQKGEWQGKRLLPEAWIEEASSKKILQDPEAPKEKVDASDWLQGYAYQMWRSRHDSYRADGAFGQFILILPEKDAVIIITSETPDLQGELDLVWEYLLPSFDMDLPKNAAISDQQLQEKLEKLSIEPLQSEPNVALQQQISGNYYQLAENDKADAISLSFTEETCELIIDQGGNSHPFSFGSGEWVMGETARKGPYLVSRAKGALEGLDPFKVAGSYAWKDEQILELQLKYIESPHTETIRIVFEDDEKITLDFESILNRNAERKLIEGKAVEIIAAY
ncbi:serine hydrolase domain-containing protein [Negadavirga shengliensis]|uniref:Serine hydrolase domain-containing protein n=1 Tax=Negadavirga shengliensis TaxID=1389218 RepID=A0ABV9T0F1_9BACT